ncbi:hypothetical protein GGD81_003221 [Rhodobium orientis]|uniref:Transmembrane protein n=1 Tax=Rhodobium orientis TaxID=34017 RepID=A0A327JPN1_9HYPH|nr:hypothetical protein [Rhodobium orientis]MBB4304165.1 hypothetical protein [Rhodobium orientis]MBK5950636.1 hypothetical protein [Rhodobium orientis]RAI28021.1 hypothetical protein CH339_07910 [Rhodobium orientis]
MNTLMKKTVTGFTALSILAGAFAATAAPAAAGPLNVGPAVAAASADTTAEVQKVGWRHRHRRHHRWHRGHGRGWGYGAAALGFAAGAAYVATRDCGWEIVRKKRYNRWGERVIVRKKVWVCD